MRERFRSNTASLQEPELAHLEEAVAAWRWAQQGEVDVKPGEGPVVEESPSTLVTFHDTQTPAADAAMDKVLRARQALDQGRGPRTPIGRYRWRKKFGHPTSAPASVAPDSVAETLMRSGTVGQSVILGTPYRVVPSSVEDGVAMEDTSPVLRMSPNTALRKLRENRKGFSH